MTMRLLTSRLMATACITTLLLCSFSNAHASKNFYKWVDEKGVTHYSAHPPAKAQEEAIKVRTTNLKADEPAPAEAGKGDTPAATPAATPPLEGTVVRDKSPELCKQARQNLKTFEENARLRLKDDKTGEMRYLTPDEMQSQKDLANKQVKDNC